MEYRKRMANGTMRRVFITEKRSFKISWSMLPAENKRAVDGFWATKALTAFYLATNGSFTMRITYGDNTFEDVLVMLTSFNKTLVKRSSYGDMYEVDLTVEEV